MGCRFSHASTYAVSVRDTARYRCPLMWLRLTSRGKHISMRNSQEERGKYALSQKGNGSDNVTGARCHAHTRRETEVQREEIHTERMNDGIIIPKDCAKFQACFIGVHVYITSWGELM